VMSGSGGGRVFTFPRLLSRKRISVDLELFRLRYILCRPGYNIVDLGSPSSDLSGRDDKRI